METLKISPSVLDNYRTCLHGKFGKSIADFVEGLDKPWEKTLAQSKGDAYHKLLELGGDTFLQHDENGNDIYVVHEPDMNIDWKFNQVQAQPALDTFTGFPNKQHEVWGRLELEILRNPIRMNLRVDALDTPMIWDYKTTGKPPRSENYAGTTQWPLYMMAYPECTAFRYRVFHLTDYGCAAHDYLFERSIEHEKVAVRWLTHLVDFIITNDLQPKFALK